MGVGTLDFVVAESAGKWVAVVFDVHHEAMKGVCWCRGGWRRCGE